MRPARSPPSANSITIERILPHYWKKAPLYLITLGESIEARSLTSLRALSFSLADNDIILIVFIAKIFPSYLRLTFNTRPKLPLPSSFIT